MRIRNHAGRWRHWLPAVVLAVLLYSLAGVSQQKLSLAYKWVVGDGYDYSVYIIGQVNTSEGAKQDIRIQYKEQTEVRGEDPSNGLFLLAVKSENYQGTKFDLKSFGLPNQGELVERTVDVYGRVANVARYSEGSRYYLLPLVLAQIPIAVGGKWKLTQDVKLPVLDNEAAVPVVIIYTFEDINRNYKGRKQNCARIRVDANYRYETEAGTDGVSGSYQGRIVFGLDTGQVVDYQINENRKEWTQKDNRIKTTKVQITKIAHE